MKVQATHIVIEQAVEGVSAAIGYPVTIEYKLGKHSSAPCFELHVSPDSPFAARKGGIPTNHACRHVTLLVLKRLHQLAAGQMATVWKHNIKLTWSAHFISMRVHLAYDKKGLKCPSNPTHDIIASQGASTVLWAWKHKDQPEDVIAPAPPKPAPVPHTPPQAPSATLLVVEPLSGTLPSGESTEAPPQSHGGGAIRRIDVAATGFYVLMDLHTRAQMMLGFQRFGEGGFDEDTIGWRQTIAMRQIKVDMALYAERFSRNLFDALVGMCVGEARHSAHVTWPSDFPKPTSRGDAYKRAPAYDPRYLIPAMKRVFLETPWGGGMGGPKWAALAQAAALYLRGSKPSQRMVMADHCIDLCHNGGLAWNKSYIFTNPPSQSEFITLLDTKRHGSLLESNLTLPVPLSIYDTYFDVFGPYLAREIMGARPSCRFEPTDDPIIPTIQWGGSVLTLSSSTVHPPVPMKVSTLTGKVQAKQAKWPETSVVPNAEFPSAEERKELTIA